MQGFAKYKFAGLARIQASLTAADRPTTEHLGEGCDIRLRVAATDTQRMQLQNLARQILVDVQFTVTNAAALCALCELRVRSHRRLIIEIQDHRRMRLHRQQHVVEVAMQIGSYSFVLKRARQRRYRDLVGRYRKMIAPKMNQA